MKGLAFLRNIFLFSVLVVSPVFSQGYEIKITIKNVRDTVLLGHYFAKSDMLIPDDTIVLDNKNTGILKGKQPLAKGVYFIYTKGRRFDLIIGDNQKFGIQADTSDLINKVSFTSSPENDVFYNFQRYNVERGKKFQEYNDKFMAAASEAEKNSIRAQMQKMHQERLDYIIKEAEAHPDLYVSKFLKSLIPPNYNLPEPPRDAQGRITDSTYVYRWYKAHFFDNLNIYDPDMLRTPFYEERVMDYMTRAIPQHPDSICAEADKILAKAKANDDIFRCILVTVFNYYVKSKVIVHENVWIHLADKWYIPYASWSDADYIEKLQKEVKLKMPNLIGKPAPPMEMLMSLPPDHFKAAALDTAIKFDLHAGTMIPDFRQSIKARYLAIFFWDIGCSHCKKTIQDLHKVYEEYKNKGFQVITIQTVITKDAKGKWIDFTNDHNLFGWINAWSPYSNKFRDLYDVSMTPILYLLDSKKDILIKRIAPEQIKDFIDPGK